jgi:hypothetical protein
MIVKIRLDLEEILFNFSTRYWIKKGQEVI